MYSKKNEWISKGARHFCCGYNRVLTGVALCSGTKGKRCEGVPGGMGEELDSPVPVTRSSPFSVSRQVSLAELARETHTQEAVLTGVVQVNLQIQGNCYHQRSDIRLAYSPEVPGALPLDRWRPASLRAREWQHLQGVTLPILWSHKTRIYKKRMRLKL